MKTALCYLQIKFNLKMPYENQFQTLQKWIHEILNAIKKDIKTDHLRADPVFYRTYFGNRPQNRLTAEEIFAAYEKELLRAMKSWPNGW